MDTAIANGDLNPTDASAVLMHNNIYNMLILTSRARMMSWTRWRRSVASWGRPACPTSRTSTNSTSLAAAVNNLGVIVREAVIGPDQ
eukprot:1272950-Prymnesium_polylepis.1